MAANTVRNPELVQSESTPEVVQVYAAAGTTGTSVWKSGEFLRVTTGGVLVAITDGATTGGISHYAISDRANGDAEGMVSCIKITPDMVFKGFAKASTALTEAWRGQQYLLDVTSNVVTVDQAAGASANGVKIVDLGYTREPQAFSIADTYPCVYFSVLTAVIEAALAA
jgi:hypothetical protein